MAPLWTLVLVYSLLTGTSGALLDSVVQQASAAGSVDKLLQGEDSWPGEHRSCITRGCPPGGMLFMNRWPFNFWFIHSVMKKQAMLPRAPFCIVYPDKLLSMCV